MKDVVWYFGGGRGWDEYIDKSVGPFLKIILPMFPTCYAYVYSGESTTSMLLLRSFLVVSLHSPVSFLYPEQIDKYSFTSIS